MENKETEHLVSIEREMIRLGAQMIPFNIVAATLLPIEGDKYVAVGTLSGITALAGRGMGTPVESKAVLTEEVRAAMKKAYNYGQTYWQQADSDYVSQHKKADVTAGRFIELNNEICAKVEAAVLASADNPSTAAAAPTVHFTNAAEIRAQALEEVGNLIDKKVNNYVGECGSYDYSTGAMEFPGNGAEWVAEMEELAEEIRALAGQQVAQVGDAS